MPNMRAKMVVSSVTSYGPESERVHFNAVSSKPYDKDGNSEDNTYAKYTPSGDCSLTINNPALVGTHKVGDKFYLDFTKADE